MDNPFTYFLLCVAIYVGAAWLRTRGSWVQILPGAPYKSSG